MKFTNGCWLQKEGTESFSPAEVYYINLDGRRVEQIEGVQECREISICAPTHRIYHRGDTLGGVNLTIRISAPAKEVFRIRAEHYMGLIHRNPDFDLNRNEEEFLVSDTDGKIRIKNGSLEIIIDKSNWKLSYYRDGEYITESQGRDLAYVKTNWKGYYYDDGGSDCTYMRERLSLSVGEYIYGLGERFTPFIKNGQSIDTWNEDGGTSTEQSYKSIPFYISNRGYGVFVNNSGNVSFEVGSELVKKVQFSVKGESIDYYFFNGPSMKEVLTHYTDLTGKPALPPAWSFGLWLSTSFTTNYDENTVNSFVDGMISHGIPLKVFHFDCFWMKEFHWSDLLWDSRVFPDPQGMLSRLKDKGLKICVWINPYIGQESALFQEGKEKGYFIKRPNGDVWQWDMWQPGMAIIDFTNPYACQWFCEKLENLLDMGVDCFKTDFGERIPVNVQYFDGSDPERMHNYYSYLYNKVVFDLLERKRGKGEAVLFARSATVGGQKFPVHWGGDCWSDYESMAESLRGGLSLTMSGFGFWSHDIGGFESTSTPDVYKRWAAFGLLSTHSRLHGSHSYRVPWAYDEESVEVVRFFTRLKAKLMPYLFAHAIQTAALGIPSMRSMILEFPEDPTCAYLDRQYMLGDSLLVAPIFNPEGLAHYYLPEGSWTNFFTGEKVKGGRWIKEHHGYTSIPLMVRENSIIARGAKDEDAVYSYGENVQLWVYELQEDTPAKTKVYSPDGVLVLETEILKKEGQLFIQMKADCPYEIILVNDMNLRSMEEGEIEHSGENTIIKPRNLIFRTTMIGTYKE